MAMLRKRLTDRFNLGFHLEKKEMSVYVLTLAKNGSKLKESEKSRTPAGENVEGPPPLVFVLAPDVVRVPARDARRCPRSAASQGQLAIALRRGFTVESESPRASSAARNRRAIRRFVCASRSGNESVGWWSSYGWRAGHLAV